VKPQNGYLQRLAEIDAAVARARPDPEVLLARASGLLAGRAGCRISEAHAHLLELAREQGRDSQEVAAEALAALEGKSRPGFRRVRTSLERALRPPRRPAADDRRSPPPDDHPATDGWAGIAQQILDGMAGHHTVLMPVRDEADEVADYLFVAVSPSVVDLSGRRGAHIVGRRVSEVYPAIVDSPVWHAWRQVLADGQPREIGPLPYVGGSDRAPAQVTIMVRVQPAGPGLLNSWARPDEQARLNERIAHTERLGNLGWGEADLVTGDIVWSDELYHIYERDPADGPLSSQEQDALTLPEDEPIRRQAVESFGRGETIDVTYRIRIEDRIKHVRNVIDAVRDVNGRPVKLYGIVQDVTAKEGNRATLAEVKKQLDEHRQTLAAEHRLAVQLQQIVLPIPVAPIDLPGLRVAVRYLPAEQASRVGGDWYHAAAADDGSAVIAVGDVAGHGIHAATTMAQLRHAFAALTVTTTTDPAELLAHLNRLLYASGNLAGTATAIAARYHPPTMTLRWAQAGHPAPLHARAGTTTELNRPHGPLLGAIRNPTYASATTTIDPGDLLVFYTDGLIEHRHHTLAEGLAPVVATLNRISAESTQQPLADLLAQLPRANPDDDSCILAARPLVAVPMPPAAENGRDA
jgi:serine phosphatase RsbU (regulator of sigma subunit)